MIRRRELQIEKEPHGSRHRVWVLMNDDEGVATVDEAADAASTSPNDSDDTSDNELTDGTDASVKVELAVLRERVKSVEGLADYHRELLKDSQWRYQQAMDQLGVSQKNLENLTRALPAAHPEEHTTAPRWPRRPFRKGTTQLP